ncbi:hypothetical protein BJX62DRAFT_243238 [Aspergillus germanicus]
MHGQPFQASKFAATLRRYLYRKHLGLLAPQNMRKPDSHFVPAPVPTKYDYGSAEDIVVSDPLSDALIARWNETARTNTFAFRKVFAPMPDDTAKSWLAYQSLFWKRFTGLDGLHMAVQKRNLSCGEEGAREVKEKLAKVRGTLVEMPLEFLVDTDIQIEDPGYNVITTQGCV